MVDLAEVYLKSGEFNLRLSEKISGAWAKKMRKIVISPTGRKLVADILKKHKGMVNVDITDKVRVTGTVMAYRPQVR